MKLIPRKTFLQLHVWAGLTIGLVLVVLAISGAMLAWRPQLDPSVDSRLKNVEPGPSRLAPEDLIHRARAVHPDGSVESVRIFGDPTAPFLVYFTTKDYVHMNPYTGEVLGVRKRYGDFFGFFEGVHKFLQVDPSIGEPITGGTAMVFGAVIVSGLILWWPATRKALKAGLTLNGKLKGRPWNLNLHKVVGIYAAGVVLVSVVTGVPIALDWVKNLIYPLTLSVRVDPPKVHGARDGFVGVNAIARSIEAMAPATREIYIALPRRGNVSTYYVALAANHPNARSYIWFNPSDGHVLRAIPYEQASRGFRLYYWMLSFHTGMIGGWPVQLILFLGALSVPLLAYTGTASYLKRRSGRAARATAPPRVDSLGSSPSAALEAPSSS